mmetsp:Transcript_31183/g.79493  ORF Transcript_31183/g.79493 Transcript_31183/m.79493 type:complete len:413 (-) Transcript_31183:984-2222(-)
MLLAALHQANDMPQKHACTTHPLATRSTCTMLVPRMQHKPHPAATHMRPRNADATTPLRAPRALHLGAKALGAKVVAVVAHRGAVLRLQLGALRGAVAQAAADGAALDARRRRQLLHLLQRVVQREQEVRHALLGLLEQVLQVQQDGLVGVPRVDERGGHARLAAAARTTDPVHVVLNLVRHVVVDHVLDVRKVQTLGRDVGGHQHVLHPALERVNRALALLLLLVAVDGHRLHALDQQVLVDGVHVALVLRKDQHGRRGLLQALEQVAQLGLLLDVLDLLDDVQVGRARAPHVDLHRVHQRALGKRLDLGGHGRAEHQRLALALEEGQHVAHLLLKPAVDHAVGLIQADVPADVQVHALLVQQVLQAPGGAHRHVHALLDDLVLRFDIHAAHHQHGAQLGVARLAQAVAVV